MRNEMTDSKGRRFRTAVESNPPLQIPGAINAYCALLAERAGFEALYLSGAGVANASFGMPDLAVTSMNDVLEDVRRITGATELPLLVDADTGWGTAFNIARTAREMIRAGAAGMHIEDQVQAKRCGHRPGKALVSCGEMQDRLKAATDARDDESFVVMARTDAYAAEGLDGAIDRAARYVEAGADMIFAEALATLEEFRAFTSRLDVKAADPEAVADALRAVIASYGRGDPRDEVLIQPMVRDPAVAGVVTTRVVDTGAPYLVLNYDDESGKPDAITGGTGVNKTVRVHRDTPEAA